MSKTHVRRGVRGLEVDELGERASDVHAEPGHGGHPVEEGRGGLGGGGRGGLGVVGGRGDLVRVHGVRGQVVPAVLAAELLCGD